MRAIEPTRSGRLKTNGFEIAYDVFGDPQAPPILLLPCWQIVDRRHWKAQIPHLARSFQVIAWDPPGIGDGERTSDPAAFNCDRVVDFGIGLLDELGIERAALIGFSLGGTFALWMAARYPERVSRAVLIGSAPPEWRYTDDPTFRVVRESYSGAEKRNIHYWRADWDGWLEFFFAQVASDPHSTKIFEDAYDWGHGTTAEILSATVHNPALMPELPTEEALRRVRCPVLLIHGTEDRIADVSASRTWAAARPDFNYLEIEGAGHAVIMRQPVAINRAISDFLGPAQPARRTWRPAMKRDERRALFISSPIGLGHVQRDLAIARALRRLVPDLRIDWLAQPPVSQVLERAGESIHPLSRQLASESRHWESHARLDEHRLHCFQAFRDMDEILLANFMVFLDAVSETPYDLWIGDEAWEVDHFLHENPELKTAPYVFMTDFIGWLPMDSAPSSREAFLTADYNAEMLEHIARYPHLRDRSLYFGDFDDIPPERFGPGLPALRDWAREHFDAVGYALPFDPADFADRRAVRARLGYDPEQPLVVCAVGGTAVGAPLLREAADAWPLIRSARPEARCEIIAGPRIDPDSIPRHPGLSVRPYVHDLYEHLAVADLGIVQGGLSTTMELAAGRRPFLYFPLRDHCEQVYHVAYRLDRLRAGRRLDYAETTPESLAEAALELLASDTRGYRPIEPDAAERAAARIAELC